MQLIEASFRPLTRSSVSPHRHEWLEWHYVLGGHCGFLIDGRRRELKSGDCFVVPPGQVHGVHIAGPQEWLLQYIVSTEADPQLLTAWQGGCNRRGVRPIGQHHHARFARIVREWCSHDPWAQRAAGHRFAALVCGLLADENAAEPRHPGIERALDLMRQRLRSQVSLPELAAAAGLERAYFARLFKRQLGSPPLGFFTGMKMELAAALLRSGDEPVGRIAQQVGFDDPFHFSRVFRRWSGCPPSDWRRSAPAP